MTDGDRARLTLEPIAPAPQVGLLLAALEDSRRRTLRELEPVTDEMLAWQPSEPLSSIGQLLYHVALIEADWLLSDILHLAEDEWPDWISGEFPIDVRNEAATSRACRRSRSLVPWLGSLAYAPTCWRH